MILQSIFIFVFGLVFGSFISALTWRYPRRISVAKGRSICPNCKGPIRWFDNIPLFSFIFLKGKCRQCRKPISVRYPLIELTTGLGFLFLSRLLFSNYFEFIYSLIILLILISIFVIDLENKIIPDSFTFFGIFVVSVYYLIFNPQSLMMLFLIGLTSSLLLLCINLATKGRGMGLGDVKFAVLGGLLVGPRFFLIWLLLAFLTGAVVGIILILGKKAGLKSQIAFGPFLVFAVPLVLLYGEKILFWLHLS
jgi:prepilin signal peptidase PulO-like enzyme (type II secretory pathway)